MTIEVRTKYVFKGEEYYTFQEAQFAELNYEMYHSIKDIAARVADVFAEYLKGSEKPFEIEKVGDVLRKWAYEYAKILLSTIDTEESNDTPS